MQKKQERKKEMNLKKRLLMILLPIVLIMTLSAQTSKENRNNSDNDLGIDLARTYQGKEVQAIIDIILEESDNSIDKAYKEGYKQATVELLPEVEYWKTMYENQKKNTLTKILTFSLISFGSGLIVGEVSGITIGLKIPIN
jgi:hypothetical protein